jgi:hypothetical protein
MLVATVVGLSCCHRESVLAEVVTSGIELTEKIVCFQARFRFQMPRVRRRRAARHRCLIALRGLAGCVAASLIEKCLSDLQVPR